MSMPCFFLKHGLLLIAVVVLLTVVEAGKSFGRYRGREHIARQSSHMHIHAPYHVQFVKGHFVEHIKKRFADADEDENEELSHHEFVRLIDMVVLDHREETKSTELAPHPIHIDDVYKDFDANEDNVIDLHTECHEANALHSVNQWLQQAEIVAEHERHPHTLESRTHPKRFVAFNAREIKELLHTITDVDRDEQWTEEELGDTLHVLHKQDHGYSYTRLRSATDMFRRLDRDRTFSLNQREIYEPRHPNDEDLDEFIDQEALRATVIEFEDRTGYTHDPTRFDYLLEHDKEEKRRQEEAEENANGEFAKEDAAEAL
jgi:hypothetical protein